MFLIIIFSNITNPNEVKSNSVEISLNKIKIIFDVERMLFNPSSRIDFLIFFSVIGGPLCLIIAAIFDKKNASLDF